MTPEQQVEEIFTILGEHLEPVQIFFWLVTPTDDFRHLSPYQKILCKEGGDVLNHIRRAYL